MRCVLSCSGMQTITHATNDHSWQCVVMYTHRIQHSFVIISVYNDYSLCKLWNGLLFGWPKQTLYFGWRWQYIENRSANVSGHATCKYRLFIYLGKFLSNVMVSVWLCLLHAKDFLSCPRFLTDYQDFTRKSTAPQYIFLRPHALPQPQIPTPKPVLPQSWINPHYQGLSMPRWVDVGYVLQLVIRINSSPCFSKTPCHSFTCWSFFLFVFFLNFFLAKLAMHWFGTNHLSLGVLTMVTFYSFMKNFFILKGQNNKFRKC